MRAQRRLPIPLPPPEVCRLPLAASVLELGLHGVWDYGLIAARSSGSRQPSSPPAAAQPTKELTEDQRNYANLHGASNHKDIISVAYETTAQRDYVREGGMWLFEIPTQRSSFCIVFMPLATKWAPGVLEQLSTTVFYRTVRQNGSLPRVTQDEIIHIGKQLLQRYTTIDSKMLEMAEEYANTNGQPFDEATANRACLADIMGNTSPFNAIPDNELQYYTFVMTNGAWQPLALLQSETERYYVVEALTVAPANNMSHLTHLGAARPHRWLSRFRDFADPANHHLKFARALALPADKWELDAILPARSGLCREDKWLSGRYPNMDGPNYEHPEAHTYLMAAVASSTRPPERLLQVAEFCLTGNQLPTVAGNNTRERNAVKPNLLVAGYRMATMPQMALTKPAAAPANIIDEDEEGSADSPPQQPTHTTKQPSATPPLDLPMRARLWDKTGGHGGLYQ
eukprot:XP_001690699.1 predicted protein [Chlamydomonas reinhardtii]